MNKYEIRRLCLARLRDEYCEGKAVCVAKRINREASYVSRMLYPEGKSGRKRIAEEMAEVIETAFGLPKGWLDNPQNLNDTVLKHSIPEGDSVESDVFRIDVLDFSVSAGAGAVNGEFVEILRSVEYAPPDARVMFSGRRADQLRIINVRGDSMSGTIEPGDLLFIDVSVQKFDGDGIYAFLYDETAHVKRLQMMKDRLMVLSDNKIYAPREPIERDEMDRVHIFGKVIGSMPQTWRKHG